jgi:DNA replicative helicase MCM subunit Mcm2 (Cdc46/Mcm family)
VNERVIRVMDLPHGTTRALLACRDCGNEYSAHRGDYFLDDPEEIMTCCGRPLQLVTKRTVYEPVELSA